jgi:hypothetical protein
MARKRVPETETTAPTPQQQPEASPTENLPALQAPVVTKKDLVNTELVDQAVLFINEKANETLYKGYEEIGTYLLNNFFQGDIRQASSRNPFKSASYVALCKRTDLAVHPATLSIMVRVAAQERFFSSEGIKTEGLSHTHKAELVKLPDGAEKAALVERVLKESLTTRQVADEVKRIRDELPRDEPKPALLLAAIERCIGNPLLLFEHSGRSSFIADKSNLQKMRPDTRQKIYDKTLSMIELTREWMERYEALKKQLEEIDRGKQREEEPSE